MENIHKVVAERRIFLIRLVAKLTEEISSENADMSSVNNFL